MSSYTSIYCSPPAHTYSFVACLRSNFDVSLANALLFVQGGKIFGPSKANTFIGQEFLSCYFWAIRNMQQFLYGNMQRVKSLTELGLEERGYKMVQRFCEQVDSDARNGTTHGILNSMNVISSYLCSMLSILDIECLRCLEDMHQHDTYSIRWKCVEIPPPIFPFKTCFMCHQASHEQVTSHHRIFRPCPYHMQPSKIGEKSLF